MEEIKLDDDVVYSKDAGGCLMIRTPKKVATVKLCGCLSFEIDDTMAWQRPTDEQIKNLKEMFCIEVIPYEEN